jgi:hypothetical protein
VLDTRAEDAAGQAGLSLGTAAGGALELTLCDGRTENRWASDAGRLKAGWLHHVAVMVDGGPRVITFVIDGVLCDGGGKRQFGWGRFSPHLRHANGAKWLRIAPRMQGAVKALRIYSRHLRTSEAVGNYRAGPAPRSRAGRSKARREP